MHIKDDQDVGGKPRPKKLAMAGQSVFGCEHFQKVFCHALPLANFQSIRHLHWAPHHLRGARPGSDLMQGSRVRQCSNNSRIIYRPVSIEKRGHIDEPSLRPLRILVKRCSTLWYLKNSREYLKNSSRCLWHPAESWGPWGYLLRSASIF